MGAHWASDFEAVTARFVRLHILACKTPQSVSSLWEFQVFMRPEAWEKAGEWRLGTGTESGEFRVDLSGSVLNPGQYEVRFVSADGNVPFEVTEVSRWFEGHEAGASFLTRTMPRVFLLNRTQAVGVGAFSAVHFRINAPAGTSGRVEVRWK